MHICRGTKPTWILWMLAILALAAGIALRFLAQWLPANARPGPAVGWALSAAALLLVLFLLGWTWRGTPHGVYVTPRNVASLSALQLFLWTGLIGSVLLVVAVWNVDGFEDGDAVNEQALQAGATVATAGFSMGIVVAKKRHRAEARGLVETAKKRVAGNPAKAARHLEAALGNPSTDGLVMRRKVVENRVKAIVTELEGYDGAGAASRAEAKLRGTLSQVGTNLDASAMESLLLGEEPAGLNLSPTQLAHLRDGLKRAAQAVALEELRRHSDGTTFRNTCPCEAKFINVLEGDEIVNADNKELARVQFLLFTLIGAIAFAVICWQAFEGQTFTGVGVPDLPQGLTELFAISGAGYLGYKLPNRTRTEP